MTKNKLIILIFAVILLIIIFIVFNSLKTSPELSKEKFVEVYVQLSIASEMYETNPDTLEQERKKIFQDNGVSQEEIDHFVKVYNQNPEKWAEVWEKVVRRLEEEKEKN